MAKPIILAPWELATSRRTRTLLARLLIRLAGRCVDLAELIAPWLGE